MSCGSGQKRNILDAITRLQHRCKPIGDTTGFRCYLGSGRWTDWDNIVAYEKKVI